ncbi:hypothetical protein CFC21_007677 [Triticum aestivum]|uniref:Ribosomal protein L17 n=2 Tax=Triticum aestivum TaxID=4565 RepID=A0A9R1DF66_WHEAT|nr:hypothetical protein CFC21_007677 [Triticum aestivum]
MGNFRKLGRHAAHRVSMLRTMVSQLVKHERIETTVAKAKEVRRKADQMVQLGKYGTLDAARRASAFVRGIELVGIQDYCEPGYELAMLHQWLTSSLSTGRMNFERPNLRLHRLPSVPLLMHGPSPVPANSGQGLKLARTLKQKGYENQKHRLSLFYVCEVFFIFRHAN